MLSCVRIDASEHAFICVPRNQRIYLKLLSKMRVEYCIVCCSAADAHAHAQTGCTTTTGAWLWLLLARCTCTSTGETTVATVIVTWAPRGWSASAAGRTRMAWPPGTRGTTRCTMHGPRSRSTRSAIQPGYIAACIHPLRWQDQQDRSVRDQHAWNDRQRRQADRGGVHVQAGATTRIGRSQSRAHTRSAIHPCMRAPPLSARTGLVRVRRLDHPLVASTQVSFSAYSSAAMSDITLANMSLMSVRSLCTLNTTRSSSGWGMW